MTGRHAHFDPFSGAAGDMVLGALVDAGLDPALLVALPARLGLSGVEVAVERVRRGPLAAAHVDVRLPHTSGEDPGALTHGAHGRTLDEIRRIIEAAELPTTVKARSTRIFERLAWAEGHVHGTPLEQVHFHEVGADDALVDVVGAVLGLEALGVTSVSVGPFSLGRGEVRTAHGCLPLPSPATAALLQGFPVKQLALEAELVTPTGAAILTALAAGDNTPPPMTLESVGCGAGKRELPDRPNLLRVLLGRPAAAPETDQVTVLTTALDDVTGEQIGHLSAQLLAAGALDVTLTALQMKKGRPGLELQVLCPPEARDRLEALLFRGSGTFGIRRQLVERAVLSRRHEQVETPYGAVRIKVGSRAGEDLVAAPEFEDCSALAARHAVPWRTVHDAALAAYLAREL